jgi:hypothetical protein
VVVGMAALVVAESPQPAFAAGGSISVTSVTRLSTVRSIRPQISSDGRFTAFGDISGAGGVRVAEAGVAGSIQVAVNGQGQVADNAFNTPEGFSADGRHLVIVGEAGNLTPTDTLRRYRVYTLDRDADGNGVLDEPGSTTLRRIPGRVAAGGLPSPSGAALADISNTGRYVAFTQPDVDGASSCYRSYRYDRDTDGDGLFDEPGNTAVLEVTVDSAEVPGARTGGCLSGTGSLDISGNGQHIVFTSDFDNLVAGDTNNRADVFVRDVDAGTTIRVPFTTTGFFGPGEASAGGISADGRFVVVRTQGDGDIIRYDRDADADGIFDEVDGTAVVMVESDTLGGLPAISGDGGTIAYSTPTAIKVWRPAAGVVSVLPRIVNLSARISLNASGNVFAFETRDVYDASDVNNTDDVYRVEITGGAPVAATVSVSAAATTPPAASEIPITNIPPQLIRNANFDVSAAPGGGVKRAPGGGVKRAPGGGVKRAPGGGLKRAPGGGLKRADELANAALVGAHRWRLGIAAPREPAGSPPADDHTRSGSRHPRRRWPRARRSRPHEHAACESQRRRLRPRGNPTQLAANQRLHHVVHAVAGADNEVVRLHRGGSVDDLDRTRDARRHTGVARRVSGACPDTDQHQPQPRSTSSRRCPHPPRNLRHARTRRQQGGRSPGFHCDRRHTRSRVAPSRPDRQHRPGPRLRHGVL